MNDNENTQKEILEAYNQYNSNLKFDITKFKDNKDIVIETQRASLRFENYGTPMIVNLN